MRKTLKRYIIGLGILLSLVNAAFAGDSISFSVSCTIPAIPGVNAPPFPEEKTVKTETATTVQQETKTNQEEPKTESPSMIQEDTVERTKLVKTIYSR